ncbi:hypothetical protein DACRYDRAFT_18560 [Dacryopinax primogenitus]|uniref:Uncharacterized protein n=1 Tax=Dacryopinax primogenitus (strain DJM 731) TaxID=1858805 RepID=M5FQ90_DACPD|nr:uncharacterized protein DACRYDRAFT_18560 [Dacryopinax primogenitus]EJT97583.1 hypothetical protein DACRYDRAFT_18560 [Dacryopinax primogenitus]
MPTRVISANPAHPTRLYDGGNEARWIETFYKDIDGPKGEVTFVETDPLVGVCVYAVENLHKWMKTEYAPFDMVTTPGIAELIMSMRYPPYSTKNYSRLRLVMKRRIPWAKPGSNSLMQSAWTKLFGAGVIAMFAAAAAQMLMQRK